MLTMINQVREGLQGNVLDKLAQFRFYEELNDFLSPEKRKKLFSYQFTGRPAIKDAIEAMGVPHTEIDLILVNGLSVGFDYHLCDGDRVSVYPVFESLDLTPVTRLREKPLRRSAFILDVHLGKLARLLRLSGFDTLYDNTYTDAEIIAIALQQKRIILTRDRGILKTKAVTHGYYIRATRADRQIREVLDRFDLKSQIEPFKRCMLCNGIIEKVEKKIILSELPESIACQYDAFNQCTNCGQIYWQGSHYQKMKRWLEKLFQ